MSVSFVKLFNTLTDSSVWALPDGVRVIWITLLSMANARGNVHASIVGVAGRARKSIEEVEAALEIFMSPDPHSRTKVLEGRRIIEIDGGWHLVNYEKHREAKSAEAVRESKREWWHRNRGADSKQSDSTAKLEQLDIDSKSAICISISGSGSDLEGGAGGNPTGPVPPIGDRTGAGVFDAPTIAVDPKRANVAPDDFEPTEAHRVRCKELKLDVDALLREFKLFEFNRPYSDWGRRFSRWIEDARVRAEADRAKAVSGAAKGPRSGFQGRAVLPALEPSDAHRRFAQKHSIDVDAIVADIERKGIPETLGMGRARELIGDALTKAARARARAAGAAP